MTHEEIVRAIWIFSGIFAVILTMIFLIDRNLFNPEEAKENEHAGNAP